MSERALVAAGLFAFVAVVSAPAWLNAVRGAPRGRPVLELPRNEKRCVAPVEYMRASHMRLLADWRDRVVRQQDRRFVASDGRVFEISLTGTCLRCHTDKAKFCDRCHDYAGVAPTCWDCHVDPAAMREVTP